MEADVLMPPHDCTTCDHHRIGICIEPKTMANVPFMVTTTSVWYCSQWREKVPDEGEQTTD